MRKEDCPSYPVSIFVAGDADEARNVCRHFCDEVGLCVTVTPTTYVYTGGEEEGVIIGLINYPRFPDPPRKIEFRALDLGVKLMRELGQSSVSIQTPETTHWFSIRPEDLAPIEAPSGGETGTGSVRSTSGANSSKSPNIGETNDR